MIIDGITCRQVNSQATQKKTGKALYATIPLEWLNGLQGESGKVKMVTILWCLSGIEGGGWFRVGNRICERYGVSSSQKLRILKSLRQSGHIELKTEPGKAVRVRLVKPHGWC